MARSNRAETPKLTPTPMPIVRPSEEEEALEEEVVAGAAEPVVDIDVLVEGLPMVDEGGDVEDVAGLEVVVVPVGK